MKSMCILNTDSIPMPLILRLKPDIECFSENRGHPQFFQKAKSFP